ncbi:acetoin utilization AcuB family protein [Planococcus lenghuensis]|uniref:Acetoin utilization protein AcuB n=1 Tax=Planococcus lenghuensis TaxID=2213202 RepID=A0A1Q2KX48_9BACL|nr:acetoin utilization AcuB family protein [Planococcus lenghuensis]AQQ52788.1 acetoin utilization protein AcuB [Planococcus lenghuensis]
MLLEEIMATEVHTLSPSSTVEDVLKLFREKRIRHAPIVDDAKKVIGVITERDLKNARFNSAEPDDIKSIYDVKVEEVMTKNPITGHPLDFVEESALIFYQQKIGCLPVVSNGQLVGFFTETDLLYKYIELTGAHQPGSQIEVRVPNRAGTLYEVSKVLYAHHVNVLSVLVYPDKENEANKVLVFRVKTMNPLAIIDDIRKEGFDVLWPNIPGI